MNLCGQFRAELPLLRTMCLHFEGLFPTSSISTLYSHQESSRIPISPNLVIITFPFNKITLTATLVSMKWYLVVLICISPWLIMFHIISCACEPFWFFFGDILVYLSSSFFYIWTIDLLLSCDTSSYILARRPLMGMWFANIFYLFVSHVFTCFVCPLMRGRF